MDIQTFLENNINLVDDNRFEELYAACRYEYHSKLTEVLLACGINPLEYLKTVPRKFAAESTIEGVVIPSNIEGIHDDAFDQCHSLKHIEIPDSVKFIGNFAFYECTGLESISFGNGIQSIGDLVFSDCYNLKRVDIDNLQGWCECDFTSIKSTPFPDADPDLYVNGSLVTNLVIPVGTSIIKKYAFTYCSSIESLHVPDTVKGIGKQAFYGCPELKNITLGKGVSYVDQGAFRKCNRLAHISFEGTQQQWYRILMTRSSFDSDVDITVDCIDGSLKLFD